MHGSVSIQPPPRISQNLVEVDELVAGYFNQSVSLDKQTYYARGGHIVVTHYDSFSNTKETWVHISTLSYFQLINIIYFVHRTVCTQCTGQKVSD